MGTSGFDKGHQIAVRSSAEVKSALLSVKARAQRLKCHFRGRPASQEAIVGAAILQLDRMNDRMLEAMLLEYLPRVEASAAPASAASPASRIHPGLTIDRFRLASLCDAWGIRRLRIFGSALTPRFGPDSDVDLLVEFAPGRLVGFEIAELEAELAVLFGGRRVDLVNPKYLNPHLRDAILAEAETLHGEG